MNLTGAPSPWLGYYRPNHSAVLRLFCFPYAGGGASIFRTWTPNLPPSVEVCPIQLPGREERVGEPPLTSTAQIVHTLVPSILNLLDKPFAFFGHSMGATISLELARLLRKEYNLKPVHLFVSGSSAPQFPERNRITYNLPDDEFFEDLRRLNGTPAEVLEHPELMQLLLPLLRADFEAIQTYTYSPEPPLDCPITVFGGERDEVSLEQLKAWEKQTSSHFSLHLFPGNHFFLHTARPLLLRALAKEIHQITRTI